jgi:hypothetical protein
MRGVLLSLLSVFWIIAAAGLVRAQDDARAIVAKAVAAHGGEEKLGRLRADHVRVKGTLFQDDKEFPFLGETIVQLPSQFKNVMELKVMGQNRKVVQVLNGEHGWESLDGQARDPEAARLSQMKEALYKDQLTRLTPLLKDNAYQLTALKETKIKDRPAVGIKVASKGHKDANLWFDKENGLLIKAEYTTMNNQKREVQQEEFFSDFKEVGGIKRPMKVLALQDGKKFMEAEITDVQYPEKIADSEFAKP